MNAEFEAWCYFAKRRFGALAASHAVGDNADQMATVGLSIGKVQDVAKYSADRRAHGMENTKRPIGWGGHDQNQRSPTSTVSPGPTAVPSGTTRRSEPAPSWWVSVTRSRWARGENPPAIATALSTLMLGT